MGEIRYCVIISLDPTYENNLYDDFLFELNDKSTWVFDPDNSAPINKDSMKSVKAEAFKVGELLILDSSWGREIGYPGRKPSKWGIGYQLFENVEDAIAKVKEILKKNGMA